MRFIPAHRLVERSAHATGPHVTFLFLSAIHADIEIVYIW